MNHKTFHQKTVIIIENARNYFTATNLFLCTEIPIHRTYNVRRNVQYKYLYYNIMFMTY